ncbi:hypothetical protein PSTT_10057, partial [Puccinia striiformis]
FTPSKWSVARVKLYVEAADERAKPRSYLAKWTLKLNTSRPTFSNEMAEGTLTYMPMELTHDLILEPECKFVKRFSDWIIWVKSKKFSVNMSMKEPKNPSPQSSVRLVLGIQRLPVVRHYFARCTLLGSLTSPFKSAPAGALVITHHGRRREEGRCRRDKRNGETCAREWFGTPMRSISCLSAFINSYWMSYGRATRAMVTQVTELPYNARSHIAEIRLSSSISRNPFPPICMCLKAFCEARLWSPHHSRFSSLKRRSSYLQGPYNYLLSFIYFPLSSRDHIPSHHIKLPHPPLPPPSTMAPSLVSLIGMLSILILLPQCICHYRDMATRSMNQPLSPRGTAPELILIEPNSSIATSTNSQPIPSISSNSRARLDRRAILPDISNFAHNTFGGFFGNSNKEDNGPTSPSGLAAQNSRQVVDPQELQPISSGDSRAVTSGQSNAPHPTQVSGGSTKSQLTSISTPTNSTSSPKSQPATVSSHSPSTVAQPSTPSPSPQASTTDEPADDPAPRSFSQRVGSLYKPSYRFQPLVILFTILLVIGLLLTLMSVLKCVARHERFANKKDYPTGFARVDTASKLDRSDSQRGLVSTPTHQSSRNSMCSSVHFSSGPQLGGQGGMTAHHAEYQLNEFGSDEDSKHAYDAAERDLEKHLSGPLDQPFSVASIQDSNHTYASQQQDQWLAQPADGGSFYVRGGNGEPLEDSKVFKLAHP